MRYCPLVALLALVLVAGSGDGLAAAKPRKPLKVLGMQVEGTDLSAKDKQDLFQVIQAKLKLYPHVELVRPPDADLIDVMIDLECIDIDHECLVKLGGKYGADRVLYTQVDPSEGFTLVVRAVDAGHGKVLRDETRTVATRADLAPALEQEIVAVFGRPPKPKPTTGKLIVETPQAGAQIYVNGDFAGSGRIEIAKAAGTYTVRVARDGYQEQLFDVEVTAGAKVQRTVELEFLPEPMGDRVTPPGAPEEPPEFYETWWFWTAVGAVVVGTALGAGLGVGLQKDEAPRGSVTLSVSRSKAWKDSTLSGRTR